MVIFFHFFYIETTRVVLTSESNWRSRSTIFSWRIKS